jgi:hypothetical protein
VNEGGAELLSLVVRVEVAECYQLLPPRFVLWDYQLLWFLFE